MNVNRWLIFVIMAVTLTYAVGVKNKWNKKRCIRIVTVILICFSGFRSWRMGDVFHYCYAFLECNMPDWTLNITGNGDTIGLQLFYRLIGQMGLGFEVCIFLIAVFVAVTLAVFAYRYSPSPYWSYMMYLAMGFYLASFNILKQVIAMGFIVLAMMEIIERRPVQFLLWVAIAALFHMPALVFLIAYPFANKKIDLSYFLLLAMMMLAVFFFRDEIIVQASSLYYEEDMQYEAAEVLGGKVVVMIMILVLGLILRPLQNYDKIYRQTFNVMVLAAIVQVFSVYDNVFTRLADYFYQFIVLFIPLMLQPAREQAKMYPGYVEKIRYWPPKVLYILQFGITVFAIYFYFSTINGSTALLNNFKFFWESDGASSLDMLKEMLKDYGG